MDVQPSPLFTKGYSGHDPDSFLSLLHEQQIATVIDVRRNPISRKRGFSRRALTAFLEQNGLEYLHVLELGVPHLLRKRLREGACKLAEYLHQFRDYLQGQPEALDRVYTLAGQRRCCLLCVEASSDECHRSVVAEQLALRNGGKVRVVHL